MPPHLAPHLFCSTPLPMLSPMDWAIPVARLDTILWTIISVVERVEKWKVSMINIILGAGRMVSTSRRFRNVKKGEKRDYLRGFGYQGGASREGWHRGVAELGFGKGFKEELARPGVWTMGLGAFGETLPYYENKAYIDNTKKDKWGQPVLAIDCEFKENEHKMRKDMMNDAAEMLDAAGAKNVKSFDGGSFPGMAIHEMGTARMGRDPKTSVLNAHNQMHDVPNVFITDGACMASTACQNPSLTYMALTARACDYAVKELKRQNI